MDKIGRKPETQNQNQTLLIGKRLKTKDLQYTAAERASGSATKPRPGTPEADENQKDGCRIAQPRQSLRQAIFRLDSWP